MSEANSTKVVTPRSVSDVLSAHAAAKIAAARNADHASHAPKPAKPLQSAHCASFTVSWASVAMCIGFKKPQPL